MSAPLLSILVVEDSPTQAEYLRHHLERLGHRVVLSRDGVEALAIVKTGSFDCVVSDVVMPNLDGYGLCRRLKDDPATRMLPVILVTVLDDPREVVRCLCCSADAFVRKPIDPERLEATVRGLLIREPRTVDAPDEPLALTFRGEAFTVDADRRHILDLLLTTYETAVDQNSELRELTGQLEDRSTELQAALARVKEINGELSAFTHSVSHDLKAPLRAVGGLCSILAETQGAALDDEGRALVGRITGACDQATRLVTDLLQLSRVTRAELRRRPVDLSSLAAAVADELRSGEPGRDCRVDVQAGMVASGDEALLRVVLVNLMGNAWKFSSKLPRTLIEVGAEDTPTDQLFFVRDHGAGFDPAHAADLFAPFRRLHTQADFPGTGVGLAIVQRAVRRHGGRVWAESAPGGGATFRFTLRPPDPTGTPERERVIA